MTPLQENVPRTHDVPWISYFLHSSYSQLLPVTWVCRWVQDDNPETTHSLFQPQTTGFLAGDPAVHDLTGKNTKPHASSSDPKKSRMEA